MDLSHVISYMLVMRFQNAIPASVSCCRLRPRLGITEIFYMQCYTDKKYCFIILHSFRIWIYQRPGECARRLQRVFIADRLGASGEKKDSFALDASDGEDIEGL